MSGLRTPIRALGNPRYERIIYLVISLKDEQRPRFAGNDDELSEVMKAATVEAMRTLAAGAKASRLVWVARTQPDYKHPCVKVLMQRDIGHKALNAFPRRMCSPCSEAFFRVFEKAAGGSNGHV